MKAFTLYSKEQVDLMKLIDKIKVYGKVNCTLEEFTYIFTEWHKQAFPGAKVSICAATFRENWVIDFVKYLAQYEI